MGEFTSLAVVASAGLIAFTGILLRMHWEDRRRRSQLSLPKPDAAQPVHSQRVS
jgi:hypothetical protein